MNKSPFHLSVFGANLSAVEASDTHLFLCHHLSFVSTHVMHIPGQVWSRWFSRADARPGVFSHSASLAAVTQEALSFHSFGGVSARHSFTGMPLQNHHRASALWINGTCCKHYTPQQPSQAAPSHLPITHCWAHARGKDVGWDAAVGSWERTHSWESWLNNVTICASLWYT